MSAANGLDDDAVREIEEYLDGWLVRAGIPGASVAVTDADGLVYANGLGARNVAAQAPATADTLYSFASVTKAVTALSVLVLADRGELALDDPIGAYTDYWTDVPGDPIEIRDLLSHSSGMPDDGHAERGYMFREGLPTSPTVTPEDRRRHANAAADRRVVDEDRFMYNDLGFAVAGEIVEAVDGREFGEFAEAEVLDPLGMERSRIGYGDHATVEENAAQGYTVGEEGPDPTEFDLNAVDVGDPQAAGGLLSSVRETTRILRCVANGGELDGTRLVSAETVAAMTDHQAPKRWSVDGDARGYGYGWLVDDSPAERVVGHGGTAPGVAQSWIGLAPDLDLGAAVAFNATGIPKQQVGKGVLGIAAGYDPAGFVPALALREKVRSVTGTYEGFRGTPTATVGHEGTTVTVTFGRDDADGDPDVRAVPATAARGEYEFYTVDDHVRVPVTFRESDRGMELRIGGHRLFRTHG